MLSFKPISFASSGDRRGAVGPFRTKRRFCSNFDGETKLFIVQILQKDAASKSEGLRRSFELEAHNQYLHSLKGKLAYIVNEKRRLRALLE